MEKEPFFNINDLLLFQSDEFLLSLDVFDTGNRINANIIEYKKVKLSKFPNTLEEIGKKFSCEKKINKFLATKSEFTAKIKLDKKDVFELSVSLKMN